LSPAELFKKWAPAVVTISVKGARGDGGCWNRSRAPRLTRLASRLRWRIAYLPTR
jgi:hypothetical protein